MLFTSFADPVSTDDELHVPYFFGQSSQQLMHSLQLSRCSSVVVIEDHPEVDEQREGGHRLVELQMREDDANLPRCSLAGRRLRASPSYLNLVKLASALIWPASVVVSLKLSTHVKKPSPSRKSPSW